MVHCQMSVPLLSFWFKVAQFQMSVLPQNGSVLDERFLGQVEKGGSVLNERFAPKWLSFK